MNKPTINDLIASVHDNAKAHGWWDEDRRMPELLNLISAEWAEALEEDRKGRPQHYYDIKTEICHDCAEKTGETGVCECANCPDGAKPEGIAVELIDGAIRILDLLGRWDTTCANDDITLDDLVSKQPGEDFESIPNIDDLNDVICGLNALTFHDLKTANSHIVANLLECVAVVVTYVTRKGLDPTDLLLEKHEYNKHRPYKHGKRY